MKKLTLSLWLALAAGIIALQAMPSHSAGIAPFPTCPPSCPK